MVEYLDDFECAVLFIIATGKCHLLEFIFIFQQTVDCVRQFIFPNLDSTSLFFQMLGVCPFLSGKGVDQNHRQIHGQRFRTGERTRFGDDEFTLTHHFCHFIGIAVQIHRMPEA